MAKISARGDSEAVRWKKGEAVYVLTKQGRLLYKPTSQHGYSLVGKLKSPIDEAAKLLDARFERMGFKRA